MQKRPRASFRCIGPSYLGLRFLLTARARLSKTFAGPCLGDRSSRKGGRLVRALREPRQDIEEIGRVPQCNRQNAASRFFGSSSGGLPAVPSDPNAAMLTTQGTAYVTIWHCRTCGQKCFRQAWAGRPRPSGNAESERERERERALL